MCVLSKHNFVKEGATGILIGHFFIVQDSQTIQRCSASLVPGHYCQDNHIVTEQPKILTNTLAMQDTLLSIPGRGRARF